MLNSINDQEYVGMNGYRTDNLDPKKIRRIVSRKDPVPDGIKQASMLQNVIDDTIVYFLKEVMKDLNPHLKDDTINNIVKLLNVDMTISDEKRKKLISFHEGGDDARFLAEVFPYAVNRPNKKTDDTIDYEDAPLLSEAMYECPLCHRKLVDLVKGKSIKRYRITQNFPEELNKEKYDEFNSVYPAPSVFDNPDNLIALDEECADKYLLSPTAEEYKKLREVKTMISRIYAAKMEVNNIQLEDDLDSQMDPTNKSMTVLELVDRYLETRTGIKASTRANYKFVQKILSKEDFGGKRIGEVKTSDAKLFLIKMQNDGRGYSSVKTVRGVLRPAFQMAVDDDYLQKNPFGFQLAGVVVNDSVTREAITRDQMRKFLKFVHDDNCYCKYYEVVFILFHTGMRISEFCGLTISDLDMENRIINIDHQLQRTSEMEYIIESTKTNAGTRKLPMTEEVFRCFLAILEDREAPRVEKMVGGRSGFLFLDDNGMPLVAMHWEHRFNNMVNRYNEIFREQMPNITPHVCRHTYCSNQARAGMNPKTLQYLMGHSDIGVTLNVYTHLGLEDAAAEMARMEEVESARREQEKLNGVKEGKEKQGRKMFRVV